MNRRAFSKILAGLLGGTPLLAGSGTVPASPAPLLILESPLAGFQYHSGQAVWPLLQSGDPLHLAREADNRHDEQAVAVYWKHHKLGYLPRRDNTSVAQMLDRGQNLQVRITGLMNATNPWQRVRLKVWA